MVVIIKDIFMYVKSYSCLYFKVNLNILSLNKIFKDLFMFLKSHCETLGEEGRIPKSMHVIYIHL